MSAYYLSKILAEFPVDIFLPMLTCTVFYWLVGMADNFLIFLEYLGTTSIALLAANSFGIMCGCSVSSFDKAISILVVFGLFMLALAGFMIKDRAIPIWIRWIKYLSFMRHGYLGGMIVVLSGVSFKCAELSAYVECLDTDSNGYIEGTAVLDEFEINEPYWMSMTLLFSLTALWFFIGYMFLRKSTSTKEA